MEGVSEAALDALQSDQRWRLDARNDLLLSDVHLGRAKSDASGLQTTLLTFRSVPDDLESQTMPADTTISLQPPSTDGATTTCGKSLDDDGDLILHRRRVSDMAASTVDRTPDRVKGGIVIHHRMATPLQDVGLQVWRGSLLLADYLLANSAAFEGAVGCELGAGTGLASITLAQAGARLVFATDVGRSVLDLCQVNVKANSWSFPAGQHSVIVRELDWDEPMPRHATPTGAEPADATPTTGAASTREGVIGTATGVERRFSGKGGQRGSPCEWSAADVEDLRHVQVFLAADTVYDEELTESFMRCAGQLLRPCTDCAAHNCGYENTQLNLIALKGWQQGSDGETNDGRRPRARHRVLLVALEKRYNFTLRDMDSRAAAYDHWRTLFDAVDRQETVPSTIAVTESTAGFMASSRRLRGRQINLDTVQQLLNYERGADLELWELFV